MKNIYLALTLYSLNLSANDTLYLNFSDQECSTVVTTEKFFKTKEHSIDLIVRTFYKASAYLKDKNLRAPDIKLLKMYRGSELKDGTLILKFHEDASGLLNSSACTQAINRLPLEKSLLGYPGVKKIIYLIGTKRLDEFDA